MKVAKHFFCIETRADYAPGDTYEGDKARLKALVNAGYLEAPKKPKAKSPAPEAEDKDGAPQTETK